MLRSVLLLAFVLLAQAVPAPQPPARDGASVKGSGLIKGRVTAADTGRPMRRVQIRLR